MPPIVLTSLSLLQLAVEALPLAEKAYTEFRKLIDMWFKGGVITAAQQDKLMQWTNAHQAAVLAGQVPPAWTIDPD